MNMSESDTTMGEDGDAISSAAMEDQAEGLIEQTEHALRAISAAAPSGDFLARLTGAMDAERIRDSRGEQVGEEAVSTIAPVTVPADKLDRWVRLMDEAAREATEERLKDLKANQPGEFKLMRWLMSVENTASGQEETSKKVVAFSPRKRFGMWAMSAAATFMAIFGAISLYPANQSQSLVRQGEINRETVNYSEQGMVFNEATGMAEKQYHVVVKDSVEIVDQDGRRMMISVPSSQKVVVPVEVY